MNKIFNEITEMIKPNILLHKESEFWYKQKLEFLKSNIGLYFLYREIKEKYKVLFTDVDIFDWIPVSYYLSLWLSHRDIAIFSDLEEHINFSNYDELKSLFSRYDIDFEIKMDEYNSYKKLGVDMYLRKYGYGYVLPLIGDSKIKEYYLVNIDSDVDFIATIMNYIYQKEVNTMLSCELAHKKNFLFVRKIISPKDDIAIPARYYNYLCDTYSPKIFFLEKENLINI